MKDLVFITGNQHKADYLAEWLGLPVQHQKVAVEELQELDLAKVVEHKAKAAYAVVGRPVLVEDVSLVFHGMGRLPGTFIKWFLQELGLDGLCALGRSLEDKTATVSVLYGLYDGTELRTFLGSVEGTLAAEVRSDEKSSWKNTASFNSIFIPNGSTKAYSEMTDEELRPFSHRAAAIEKLKAYLAQA
jgi:inosine triphosphate pyrophosphatase